MSVRIDSERGKGSHVTLYYGSRKTTVKDRRKEIPAGLLSAMIRHSGAAASRCGRSHRSHQARSAILTPEPRSSSARRPGTVPNHRDPGILLDLPVRSEDGGSGGEGRSDDDAVRRVFVQRRQRRGTLCDSPIDRYFLDAMMIECFGNPVSRGKRKFEGASPVFDADLESRDGGDEQIAGVVGDDAAHFGRQFSGGRREPKQGTGVEQQVQASGQSSSASGATGSSWNTIPDNRGFATSGSRFAVAIGPISATGVPDAFPALLDQPQQFREACLRFMSIHH